MKRQYILVSLFISVLLTTGILISCKKKNEKIIINGSVYDPNIQTYISNAHVTISAKLLSSGFYNSNYTELETTTTNSAGAFSFQFDKQKSAGYEIYISKDNYFDYTIDIPDANIVAGTPYTPEYDIYPIAYIKLHVKNTTPFDSTDFINYYYSTITSANCFGCCNSTSFNGYGKTYDTTLKCKTYGSQHVIISYHYHQHWDYASFDTVFCLPFDTTEHNIFY